MKKRFFAVSSAEQLNAIGLHEFASYGDVRYPLVVTELNDVIVVTSLVWHMDTGSRLLIATTGQYDVIIFLGLADAQVTDRGISDYPPPFW